MSRYKKELLYLRDLTEAEQEKIDSAKVVTPMTMCPDKGILDETQEVIDVVHALNSADGLILGFNVADGRYSTAPYSKITLTNPKFHWQYIADQHD